MHIKTKQKHLEISVHLLSITKTTSWCLCCNENLPRIRSYRWGGEVKYLILNAGHGHRDAPGIQFPGLLPCAQPCMAPSVCLIYLVEIAVTKPLTHGALINYCF